MQQHLTRSVLPNGLVILSERMAASPSCSLGLWLRRGSSAEAGWPGGITHLLEHMVFKGTRRRSARDISMAIEGRGGLLNASTGRSNTSFYANALNEDWELCLDLLADMLLESVLEPGELEKEQGVILDEIRQVEESPDELLYDLGFLDMYPGDPWGLPVQGTEAEVQAVDRTLLKRFADSCKMGGELVVAYAGDLDHERLHRRCEELFGALPPGRLVVPEAPAVTPGLIDHARGFGRQAHVQLGRTGPDAAHPDTPALSLLTLLLGDGMSSRLFQRLREDLGLCYTVYSWQESLGRGASFGAYFACEAARVDEVQAVCLAEIARLREDGVDAAELEHALSQTRGGWLIAQEQSMNRMVQLAKGELRHGRLVPLDERLARLEAQGVASLARAAREWLDPAGFQISRLLPGEDEEDDA
jgi:predicted Zn-dependent peptidase